LFTRWAATACKFYGTELGYEPAGATISAIRDPLRIFNLVGSSGDELYEYRFINGGSWDCGTDQDKLKLKESLQFFVNKTHEPVVDACMYVPQLDWQLQTMGDPRLQFEDAVKSIREVTDFDMVDDDLVNDGVLDKYGVFIVWNTGIEQDQVLSKISDWLTNNSGVMVWFGDTKLKTATGQDKYNKLFFDKKNYVGSKDKKDIKYYAYKYGKGYIIKFNEVYNLKKINELVAQAIFNLTNLAGDLVNLPKTTFPELKVFGSMLTDNGAGKILLLNADTKNQHEVKVTVDDKQQQKYKLANKEWTVKIEPLSLVELK
jgi:hypothetical protein